MNPFDYVNAINEGRNIMRGEGEQVEKGYAPFLTNRAMSYQKDAILYANEMNLNTTTDNLLQFEYYLHSLRPRKRYAKWVKRINDENVLLLMDWYKVNYRRASEYLKCLTDEQLNEIKTKSRKGGRHNE